MCSRENRRPPSRLSRLRERVRAEQGDTMIEVVVAALLLALVAGATLTGFVTVSHLSADQRWRAQAGALAQQDEERLRGMTINQLLAANGQSTQQTIGGATFTITSAAKFISASGSTPSCASGARSSADYVETSSTVTWGGLANGRAPVIEHGLVTPHVGGALVVQVTDASGTTGVPNVTVTATDSSSTQSVISTDSAGCAVFAGLAAGTATIGIAAAGYVDFNGNANPTQSARLTPTSTTTVPFQFDQGGAITANFQTKISGVAYTSSAVAFVAHNNGITSPPTGDRVFATSNGSHAASVTSPSTLFPFASAYNAYAGSCAANNPANFGQPAPTVVVPALGGTASVQLSLPALIVKVWTGTSVAPGSLVNTAPHITLTETDTGTGCDTTEYQPATQVPSAPGGALVDPGQPYGTYSICADAKTSNGQGNGNGNGNRAMNTATVTNSNPAGTIVNIYLGSGTPKQTCP